MKQGMSRSSLHCQVNTSTLKKSMYNDWTDASMGSHDTLFLVRVEI